MMRALRKIIYPAALAFAVGCSEAASAPDWREGAIVAAADFLEKEYISEETGAKLARYLRESRDKYGAVDDKAAFAQALTRDLYAIANDKHLRISYEPQDAGEEDEAATDERANIVYCRTTPIVFRMDAGVGVITLPRFFGDEEYFAQVDAVMASAASTDALVLDLRNNCGGGPQHVKYVSTYFFAEKTHLVSAEMRGQPVSERWTLDEVPGPRFVDKPVYVVTNRHTFSAGESFTFGLVATGRARTVGEATGGGGHFGDTVRLSDAFTMFLPVGRTFDPRTGDGWEATGIAPDITAEPQGAIDAAIADFKSRRQP